MSEPIVPSGTAPPALISIKEAARAAQISAARIYRWVQAGQLPSVSSPHGKCVLLAEVQMLAAALAAPKPVNEESFLPVFRAARMVGIAPATVRYWIKKEFLPTQAGPHGALVKPAEIRACAAKLGRPAP